MLRNILPLGRLFGRINMSGSFTDEERHCMMIGALELLCPFRPRYKMDFLTAEFTTAREYHYYLGGRAIGLPFIVLEILGFIKMAAALL